ncbi:hypothetical protein TNCT_565461 [Trichonephila clavata]|uniref:Uncharacterized protein n=1 Tax=Trichonephila clavata TaxID=2740835 RepID=A0A8X6G9K1_TRICU|nr:hypothetical protein TNCT_565461 [Trichonephila clavata]
MLYFAVEARLLVVNNIVHGSLRPHGSSVSLQIMPGIVSSILQIFEWDPSECAVWIKQDECIWCVYELKGCVATKIVDGIPICSWNELGYEFCINLKALANEFLKWEFTLATIHKDTDHHKLFRLNIDNFGIAVRQSTGGTLITN